MHGPHHALPTLLIALLLAAPSRAADNDVHLTDLHTQPEAWQLEPAASWRFVPSQADQPAHMVITTVGPPRNKPVRRPYTYAVLKDRPWQAATLDLDVRSLEPPTTRGRDVCIILGYVDDTHFTYIHLSNHTDNRAHNVIMKVAGNSRRTLHTPAKPEARLTGQGWHHIRVQFDAAGKITVYHGDMDTPLMSATDPDIVGHPLGLGSFNDRAAFSAITLTGH
jgi:hypothetical protein